ncbi:hypothetical protein [Candidatus Leptofilum sp.]|uniref:hypothetical protein n=1 Tax=Candidatus Leptofilum sp. TaxID=3241576 RepID=UPI003B5BFE16
MSAVVEHADKFRIIHGIGEAREKWLQETFKVYTFGALALLKVGEIEAELADAPPAISRGVEQRDIVAWLEEASQFASKNAVPATEPDTEKKSETDWNKAVRFFVEFQTRTGQAGSLEKQTKVHEMDTGKGDVWPGHTLHEPAKWMLDWIKSDDAPAAKEIVPPKEPRKATPEASPKRPTVTFGLAQVSVFQPEGATKETGIGLPDTIFSGTLLSNVPLTMECHLKVGLEDNQAEFTGSIPYQLELFATNRETGKVLPLGQKNDVVEGTGLQKVTISGVRLLPSVYRVEVIVTSPGYPCKPGFMEIPLLRTT